MFSTFLISIFGLLMQIVTLYKWVVIIAALLTWVKPDPNNPIVQILYRLTEPVYAWMRGKFKTVFGGMDFAPMIVILFLMLLESLLVSLVYG